MRPAPAPELRQRVTAGATGGDAETTAHSQLAEDGLAHLVQGGHPLGRRTAPLNQASLRQSRDHQDHRAGASDWLLYTHPIWAGGRPQVMDRASFSSHLPFKGTLCPPQAQALQGSGPGPLQTRGTWGCPVPSFFQGCTWMGAGHSRGSEG